MGEAFGEGCRAEARALYSLRLEAARRHARDHGRPLDEAQVLTACRACLPATQAWDPPGYEELAGIARGAGLSLEQCFTLQGLTDLRDLLAYGQLPEGAGCSSFVVAPDRSATGQLLLGQNWDLLTDNLPFVRLVHRRPADALETWAVTLTGCLTLIGVNAAGIAAGNTNLVTRDVRPGVQYLTVLHRALRAATLREAVAAIRGAPRAAAHYYYVAGPGGRAVGLECSATQSVAFTVDHGTFVHCNHALSPRLAALEAGPPGQSSAFRQQRLSQLLAGHAAPLDVAALQRLLADHEGGPDRCLCRHDHEGVSTNAVAILCPAAGRIHACRGQAHVGAWVVRGCERPPAARPGRPPARDPAGGGPSPQVG
jgi:isopenicillin-N N-acyltransferase-like protein